MILLFDLWDTLGTKNLSFSKALKTRFSLGEVEDFYKRYERSTMTRRFSSMEELAVSFLHEFGLEAHGRNVQYVIKAQEDVLSYATPTPGVRRALEQLSRKHRLGVLSNATCFESAVLDRWGLSQYFEEVVVSWRTGVLKPSEESFRKALEAFDADAADVTFIDNDAENCTAAEKLGMQAYQFTDEPSFEEFVRSIRGS